MERKQELEVPRESESDDAVKPAVERLTRRLDHTIPDAQ